MVYKFDIDKLKTAKDNIQSVYEFYYGSTKDKKFVSRLDTILKKLDEVIDYAESERGN